MDPCGSGRTRGLSCRLRRGRRTSAGGARLRDFSLSADAVDPARINVHEQWESEAALIRFRGNGPSDDQQVAVLDADVRRYEIASEGPAW